MREVIIFSEDDIVNMLRGEEITLRDGSYQHTFVAENTTSLYTNAKNALDLYKDSSSINDLLQGKKTPNQIREKYDLPLINDELNFEERAYAIELRQLIKESQEYDLLHLLQITKKTPSQLRDILYCGEDRRELQPGEAIPEGYIICKGGRLYELKERN